MLELSLKQPQDGYRYNSDSVVLYDFLYDLIPKGKILDVGSGCGILALLIKRDFNCTVYGVELQKEMFSLALYNRQINELDVTFINTSIQKFKSASKFDYIVSNPPFYAKETKQTRNENLAIARYDENMPFKDLVLKTKELLKENGSFVFCYKADRLSFVMSTLKDCGLSASLMRFVHPKKTKEASIVIICAKKTKAKLLKILPPFFAFSDHRPSLNFKSAVLRANTKSL